MPGEKTLKASAVAVAAFVVLNLFGGTATALTPKGTATSSAAAPVANKTATVSEVLGECPVKTNTASAGQTLSPPVELHPTQQSSERLVNLDTSRKPVIIKHVTVTTNRNLPEGVTPAQINFDASLSRTGNTLETAEFPDPTFSTPHISNDRRSISFAICLNPTGVGAGKYVGTVTVSGPEGLGNAVISLTVNAKKFQLVYWLLALLVAFLLILIKDGSRIKKEYDEKGTAMKWWKNVWKPILWDPIWLATTVVSLGAVIASLWKIYSADPAWGADGLGSLVTLVGAAAAAVGGHAVISSLSPNPKAEG